MPQLGNTRSHVGWFTRLSLTILLALVFHQSGTLGIDSYERDIDCGPPNVLRPELCKHGNFTLNFNTEDCKPRTLCYKGLNQTCHKFGDKSDCAPNLHCICGRCNADVDISCRPRALSLPIIQVLAKRMQPILQEYGF